MTDSCPFGFRIVGATSERRRLVDAAAALAGYAACDAKAEVQREGYLSAFQYGADFRGHLESTGSTRDFGGACWSPWLWFDLDNEDLHYSHQDAGALAAFLVERFDIDSGDLLIFFSGSKGFHIGLPTCWWSPSPATDFHRSARRFAENLAALASVTIDTGVYDPVRAFRAPNSRHPKTGLHKRRLTLDELLGPLDAILESARAPAPFAVPTPTRTIDQAVADWQDAADQVAKEAEAKAARRAAAGGTPTLNRATLDFIRDGAGTGDRHRLLFSAAANLAEFGCPVSLAFALLEESALDSGLPPREVRRQVDCGLAFANSTTLQHASESPFDTLVEKPPEAATSDSRGSEGQLCQPLTTVPDSTPPDVQAALAKLWQTAPTPVPKIDQGEAMPPSTVDAQGFDWRTGRQTSLAELPPLPPPSPPPGARLYLIDRAMRPCSPAAAYCWTWEGAGRWYHTAEYPIPESAKEGNP